MFEVFNFYIQSIQKVFKVYLSFEIFPGVNYLNWLGALAIIFLLIKTVRGALTSEEDTYTTINNSKSSIKKKKENKKGR